MFAQMIAVDVLVANLWMLLYGAQNQIKLTNGWKLIMPNSRIRKLEEEQAGKNTANN
jgi:hypothetical protein